jgi:hypothetical protein
MATNKKRITQFEKEHKEVGDSKVNTINQEDVRMQMIITCLLNN